MMSDSQKLCVNVSAPWTETERHWFEVFQNEFRQVIAKFNKKAHVGWLTSAPAHRFQMSPVFSSVIEVCNQFSPAHQSVSMFESGSTPDVVSDASGSNKTTFLHLPSD